MVASTRNGGVSKPKTSPSESVEKLRNAVNGNLAPAKAQAADEQASVRDGPTNEDSVETQSKPEYPEDVTSSQSESEPKDHDMVDAPSSQSIDPESSDQLGSGTSEPKSSDKDAEPMFADFRSLTLDSGERGTVDGFGGVGRARFFILRSGPRNAPSYQFKRTNGFSTDGFLNLSDFRITLIKYNNHQGGKDWRYTSKNVDGIVGSAIEVRNPLKRYKRAPQTWLKIKWKNIHKDDQHLLLVNVDYPKELSKRHSSWITKSDLVRLMGREIATSNIITAWKNQEALHLEYLNRRGQDRSPSPCPLEVFAADKQLREASRSLSPTQAQFSHGVKAEPRHLNASSVKAESPIPEYQSRRPIITIESDDDLTAMPENHAPYDQPETPRGSSAVSVDKSEGKQASRPPQRFSYDSYWKELKKRKGWKKMSKGDQMKLEEESWARYYHYKQAREALGDEEEPRPDSDSDSDSDQVT